MTLLLFPLWHGQLLWHYYDTIIVSIITRLWHYYSHYFSYYITYDRVSSTSVSQCADRSPQPEHREMTFKGPWRLELDLIHHEGALKQWKEVWGSERVLLYTLFLPLYRLLQISDQDYCCSKGVLRTAHLREMIQCVTWRWGNTTQAGFDARRAETVLCCDYYCHYCTIISLISTIIGIIAEANRSGIHWKTRPKALMMIRHHRGLVFVVPESRIDSIGDHRDDLDKPEKNEDNCHNMHNKLF